jgi:hypothetical protein
MSNGSNALARVEDTKPLVIDAEYEGLQMVVAPAEALRRVQELQAFVQKVMVAGVDYGTIPGTDKPSLFQPGAQKLAELYGFAWEFKDDGSIQDWNAPLFVFRKRCVLTSRRDGRYVGDGIGSCNSREDRYAWRWVKQAPPGVAKEHLVSRVGKWGTQYRTANPDLYSLVNTIEKMACKRAFVHAIIASTRSAGIFTQDTEDLPREVFGQAEPARSWERDDDKPPPATAAEVKALADKIDAAQDDGALKAIGKAIVDANLTDEQRKDLRAAYAKRKNKIAKLARDGAVSASESKPAPEDIRAATSAEQDAPPDDDGYRADME